jgi:hypothetical protein
MGRVMQRSPRLADRARMIVMQEVLCVAVTVTMATDARGIAPLSGHVMRHARESIRGARGVRPGTPRS